jgi:hypothetical protein
VDAGTKLHKAGHDESGAEATDINQCWDQMPCGRPRVRETDFGRRSHLRHKAAGIYYLITCLAARVLFGVRGACAAIESDAVGSGWSSPPTIR